MCFSILNYYSHFDVVWSQRRLEHVDPDSKVHGANMGPTWVLLAPDGPHVGPMNLVISGRYLPWLLMSCKQPVHQQPSVWLCLHGIFPLSPMINTNVIFIYIRGILIWQNTSHIFASWLANTGDCMLLWWQVICYLLVIHLKFIPGACFTDML